MSTTTTPLPTAPTTAPLPTAPSTTQTTEEHNKKLKQISKLPKVSKTMRVINLVLTVFVIYLSWVFNLYTFLIGILNFSGAYMPIIYLLALIAGVISLVVTIAGNGFYIYSLSLFSPIISIVAALILFNTQVYLYTVGIDS